MTWELKGRGTSQGDFPLSGGETPLLPTQKLLYALRSRPASVSGLVEIAGHLLSSASQSRQQASLEARERAAQLAMERLASPRLAPAPAPAAALLYL